MNAIDATAAMTSTIRIGFLASGVRDGTGSLSGKGAVPVTRNATPLPKFCTPYIDPLNHIQIELLRRHRAGATDERIVQGIHLTRSTNYRLPSRILQAASPIARAGSTAAREILAT
jgi:hypothetical protein